MVTIKYTVDGQPRSYSPSSSELRKLKYAMDNSVGYPADPGLDVLAFVCYLFGEPVENVYEAFDGLIDWEEMFETEPMEWFNTVVAPGLPEECGNVKIEDIEFMTYEKSNARKEVKGSVALRKLKEGTNFDVNVNFTTDELQMICNRLWVETQWGPDVYDEPDLAIMNSIINKIANVGINVQ